MLLPHPSEGYPPTLCIVKKRLWVAHCVGCQSVHLARHVLVQCLLSCCMLTVLCKSLCLHKTSTPLTERPVAALDTLSSCRCIMDSELLQPACNSKQSARTIRQVVCAPNTFELIAPVRAGFWSCIEAIMSSEDLVLDRKVRDWVVVPLTLCILLMMLLRQYVSKVRFCTVCSCKMHAIQPRILTITRVADTGKSFC